MFASRKPHGAPLHALQIEDYGLIGDCETAALVGRNGSIDWLCWPAFSSPACFAALLGTADNGHWKLAPEGPYLRSTRRYLPDSLILETTFETSTGTLVLVDFMPPRQQNSDVVRIVRCVRGSVAVRMDLAVRFDYGLTIPWVTRLDDGIRAISGPHMVVLRSTVPVEGQGFATVSSFNLAAGEEHAFTLTYASSIGRDGNAPVEDPIAVPPHKAFDATFSFWQQWSAQNTYRGPYADIAKRSLITLKAMTYRPSGGIVAAVTTSLPEKIGGNRNWDYRYCWLRDTAFTLLILLLAGYEEEAVAWRKWLLRAVAGSPDQIQTIYGLCGERQLNEWVVSWLPGFENSSPVNIGNAASEQFQLDVFGEVAAALLRTPNADDSIKLSSSSLQASLMDHLCHIWDQPDDGIWETRAGRKHFTHSKVMAWVALDRAIKHFKQYDGSGDVEGWKHNRDLLHAQICEKGFDPELNSFTQSYGSKELDASCLRIGLVGFLPMDDPRIVGTIEAIEKRLLHNGLVDRYDTKTSPDGLPPGEGTFLACSFWLVTCLWLIGRRDDATALFERLLALANDVGLLSEEWDTAGRRMLGNFPQALSHIALCHAAFALSGAWTPEPPGSPAE